MREEKLHFYVYVNTESGFCLFSGGGRPLWNEVSHFISRANSLCLIALFKLSTRSFLISFVVKERHQSQQKIDFYYQFFYEGAEVWVESWKPSGETPAESFSSEHPGSPSALLVRSFAIATIIIFCHSEI